MKPDFAERAMRVLALTYFLLSSANAYQTTRTGILPRDETNCRDVDSRLPNDFKCPTGSSCISLDNGSSALCCPSGSTCNNIQRINCDIQNQNATANPTSNIFTTKLEDSLPTCGNRCCPFGYACIDQTDSEPICNLIAGTSKAASTNTQSSSSSAVSTSRTSSTSTATSNSSTPGASSAALTSEPQCNKFPAGVFLAGFFPGIFIGAFIMLAWVICSGRHRKPDPDRSSAGSSLYKPKISDPIPMAHHSFRTDFLSKTRGRARSMFSGKSPTESPSKTRMISPKFTTNHWKMPTPPENNNTPTGSASGPVTPERRLQYGYISDHEDGGATHDFASPPVPQVPVPASIAPLRGMAGQRPPLPLRQMEPDNKMGSPFQTPPNNSNHPAYRNQSSDTRVSRFSEASVLTPEETLSPKRYEAGVLRNKGVVRPESPVRQDRRTTTFTEFMQSTGFERRGIPAVPKVPKVSGMR